MKWQPVKTLYLIACSLALLLVPAKAVEAGILYGATGSGGVNGHLLILDQTTGATITDVGALVDGSGNPYGLTGLAFDPNTGLLYGSTSNQSPTARAHLVLIDPLTAQVTDIGTFDPSGGSTMSDITFDPVTGILYAWRAASGHGLYTVDKTTGLATLVGGQTGDFGGGGIAADATGTLFNTPDGVTGSPNGHLNTVSSADGSTLTSVLLSGNSPLIIGAMDFDENGVLFGVRGQRTTFLVTINTATGAVTDLGPSADDLDAIAFQNAEAVPEPASIMLLTIGSLGLVGVRVRRRFQKTLS
jgi:hypothetical protein